MAVASFPVLCFADELAADPGLLPAFTREFGADDGVSLLIYAPDADAQATLAALESSIEAARLMDDDTLDADLVAVPSGSEAAIAQQVIAVYSTRALDDAFGSLASFSPDRLAVLRQVVEHGRAGSTPAPAAEAPRPAQPAADVNATAAFLQLVTEAAATRLVDNLDHLFYPHGHPLPDPSETGARLAEQLDVLARAGVFLRGLGDDASRELFLRFLAYRALGPEHVRLQLEPAYYRQTVIGLTQQMINQAGVLGAPGAPFEWQFHVYSLAGAGVQANVLGQPLGLASTFVFGQYAYRDAVAGAGPRPGDVALDVGGCWGETAIWLAHAVGPQGRVHTFEPAPSNRELLQKNLELNPALAQRIRVHEAPLSAREGESVWMDDAVAAGATMSDVRRSADFPAVSLRTDTIDAMVARGELERVDFIKVDVEGADLGVLEGAAQTIREQRPRLALAAYHKPDDLVRIPDFLATLGVEYRWYLQCSTMTDIDTVAFAVPV